MHRLTMVQAVTSAIINQLVNNEEIDFSQYTEPEDKEIAKLINQTVKEIKKHFE